MPAFKNLVGETFGRLTVRELCEERKCNKIQYVCICSCPNKTVKIIVGACLKNGSTRSCGCIRHDNAPENSPRGDLTGYVFGKLTVKSLAYKHKTSGAYYNVECECGNKLIRRGASLYTTLDKNMTSSCDECRGINLDIIGNTFNRITIISFSHIGTHNNAYFNCYCECNPEKIFQVKGSSVKCGGTKSCGCLKKETDLKRAHSKVENLTNKTFGLWKVISFDKFYKKRGYWLCECQCNKKTIKLVTTNTLISRQSKSCGCTRTLQLVKNNKSRAKKLTEKEKQELDKLGRRDHRPEHLEWKNAVWKRDNYTCQLTGEESKYRNGGICAHHLDGWNWCLERRYDLDNGITLALNIHDLFHNNYGWGDNTEQQFQEFKSRYDSGEWRDYQI